MAIASIYYTGSMGTSYPVRERLMETEDRCLGEVDIEGWKGKTEVEVVDETAEYYLLREYRKRNKDDKPAPIISKAYKKYIDILQGVIDQLEFREEYGKEYIFRKLFDIYHQILEANFPGWDSVPFPIQKKLWLGDRRTGDKGTYFVLYYKPMQYLCATGKVINIGQTMMRIE
jgi:hypothetical protein